MPVQPIVRSIIRPTVTGIVRSFGSFGSSFVSRFGAGLSAAYFLADLGSERGTVDSATNPVSRVRRDSDGGLRAFTAADVKGGAALDYVNNGTTALYGEAMYFDGVNDYVNFGDILGIASTGFSGSLKTFFQGEQGTLLSKGGRTGGYLLFLDENGTLFLLLKQAVSSGQYRRYDSTTTVDKSILLNISFTIGALGASFSASVNGTSLSFTDTGITGAYADTSEDFSIGSRAEGGSIFYTGVIADINITGVLTTPGNGNTDAKWADTSGNDNNGTVSGSPVLFTGQGFEGFAPTWYDPIVPTSQDYMYFDGVDDYVELDNVITMSGDFKVSWFQYLESGSDKVVVGGGADNFIRWDSTGLLVRINGVFFSFNTAPTYQQTLNYSVRRVGSNLTLARGGVDVETISGNTDDFLLVEIGTRFSAVLLGMFFGVIANLSVDVGNTGASNHEWLGDGPLDENWKDQIGSNDGTVNGSPQRVLNSDFTKISRDFSQSTAGSQPQIIKNGALVTENTKPMLDFDGSASHLRCPASEFITPTNALQVSVVCKNNNTSLSASETLISQYDSGANKRSWLIYIDVNQKLSVIFGDTSNGTFEGRWIADSVISPENLQTIGFKYNAGTVVLYVNGVEVPGSISNGSIPTSLYNSDGDATIGAYLSSNSVTALWNGQIGEVYIADNLTDDLATIQLAQMKGFNI